MQVHLTAAALGTIAGILAAGSGGISGVLLALAIFLGLALAGLAFFFRETRPISATAIFLSFFCFSLANTSRHLDTSFPGHLSQVLRGIRDASGEDIRGVVVAEPDIRERYTIVPFAVSEIVDFQGVAHPVRRGKLYVKVYPSCGDDYFRLRYGQRLTLREVMVRKPPGASNPGGFDMAHFLRNQGYFGVVRVRRSDQLRIDGEGEGNPLMFGALNIKRHLLHTIKKTLPYPESTFLGGVLLGLRSGLSYEIKNNFRAAGVAHVLAVSGLHVTIITLFLMSLMGLFRVPRIPTFVIIALSLVLFAMITGARPSTLRAVIMNVMAMVFYYFRGMGLERSLLGGIAVAAMAILFFNPLIVAEASFVFSFSAVLSLALLTGPVWEFACRYIRGFPGISIVFSGLFFFAVCLINPRLLLAHWQWTILALLAIPAGKLLEHYLRWSAGFRKLPKWLSVFIAAQVAIQMGMLPITALYFKKVSLTAAFANFIAIPLIGVIVQLGLFAGIADFIPGIGTLIALTLNAANWLLIKVFLGTASFFGTRFPYPDVFPPGKTFLVVYYGLLLGIAMHRQIRRHVFPGIRRLYQLRGARPVRVRLAALVILCLLLATNIALGVAWKAPELVVTFFDPVMFSMGGGNSIFIRTPGNFRALMDGGPRRVLMNDHEIPLDIGDKVLTPALFTYRCKHFDAMVASSPRSDYLGGLITLLRKPSFSVAQLMHGLPFNEIRPGSDLMEILSRLEDPVLTQQKRLEQSQLLAWDIQDLFKASSERDVPMIQVRDGVVIHREAVPVDGGEETLEIRVLNPPVSRFRGKYSSGSNAVVLEVRFGKCGFLLTSTIDKRAQEQLVSRRIPPVTVLQIPANGARYAQWATLPETLKPRIAVVSPVRSSWRGKMVSGAVDLYRQSGAQVFRTDTDGAVEFRCDGKNLRIKTWLSGIERVIQL